MKTVQMTLDNDLVESIDRLAKKMHTTRSALTRQALRSVLLKADIDQLEKKHKRGYSTHPSSPDEFGVWETEQKWSTE